METIHIAILHWSPLESFSHSSFAASDTFAFASDVSSLICSARRDFPSADSRSSSCCPCTPPHHTYSVHSNAATLPAKKGNICNATHDQAQQFRRCCDRQPPNFCSL